MVIFEEDFLEIEDEFEADMLEDNLADLVSDLNCKQLNWCIYQHRFNHYANFWSGDSVRYFNNMNLFEAIKFAINADDVLLFRLIVNDKHELELETHSHDNTNTYKFIPITKSFINRNKDNQFMFNYLVDNGINASYQEAMDFYKSLPYQHSVKLTKKVLLAI